MQLFWFTILLFVGTGVMFFVACCVRQWVCQRRQGRPQGKPQRQTETLTLERASNTTTCTLQVQQAQAVAQAQMPFPEQEQEQADGAQAEGQAHPQELTDQRREQGQEQERAAALELSNQVVISADEDFRRRLLHSLLILLSLYYLKLTTLCVRGMMCAWAADPAPLDGSAASSSQSLYLVVDTSIKCFSGWHAPTVAFILLLFLAYCIGFPCFCFVLLTRAFVTPEHGGIMGWLVAHCRILQSRQVDDTLSERKKKNKAIRLMRQSSEGKHRDKAQAGTTGSAPAAAAPPADTGAALSLWDAAGSYDSKAAVKAAWLASVAAKEGVRTELLSRLLHSRWRVDAFGYLFMTLRSDYPLFRVLTSFPVSLVYGLTTNLSSDTQLELFVLGVMAGACLGAVLLHRPFSSTFNNRRMAIVYSATLAHVCVTMGATLPSARYGERPYFIVLLCCWSLLTIAIFVHKGCSGICQRLDKSSDKSSGSTSGGGGGDRGMGGPSVVPSSGGGKGSSAEQGEEEFELALETSRLSTWHLAPRAASAHAGGSVAIAEGTRALGRIVLKKQLATKRAPTAIQAQQQQQQSLYEDQASHPQQQPHPVLDVVPTGRASLGKLHFQFLSPAGSNVTANPYRPLAPVRVRVAAAPRAVTVAPDDRSDGDTFSTVEQHKRAVSDSHVTHWRWVATASADADSDADADADYPCSASSVHVNGESHIIATRPATVTVPLQQVQQRAGLDTPTSPAMIAAHTFRLPSLSAADAAGCAAMAAAEAGGSSPVVAPPSRSASQQGEPRHPYPHARSLSLSSNRRARMSRSNAPQINAAAMQQLQSPAAAVAAVLAEGAEASRRRGSRLASFARPTAAAAPAMPAPAALPNAVQQQASATTTSAGAAQELADATE